jgi:hypothetical protein
MNEFDVELDSEEEERDGQGRPMTSLPARMTPSTPEVESRTGPSDTTPSEESGHPAVDRTRASGAGVGEVTADAGLGEKAPASRLSRKRKKPKPGVDAVGVPLDSKTGKVSYSCPRWMFHRSGSYCKTCGKTPA